MPYVETNAEITARRERKYEELGLKVEKRFTNRSRLYIIGYIWFQMQCVKEELHKATFREDMGR